VLSDNEKCNFSKKRKNCEVSKFRDNLNLREKGEGGGDSDPYTPHANNASNGYNLQVIKNSRQQMDTRIIYNL